MSDTLNGTAIVPAAETTLRLAPPARLPEIAKALAEARRRCKPVEKTAYNSFLKCYYAPAEAIIEAATNALKEVGLALIPMRSVVNGYAKDGSDRLELENTYLLVHEATGEYMPVVRAWPISLEKGTTLLKSTCATDTVSLAYYYRSLLAIARIDASDDPMSSPADAPNSVAPSTPVAAPSADNLPLVYLAREHHRKLGDVKAYLIALGLPNAKGWEDVPREKHARARQLIIQGLARVEQVDRIMELAGKLGIPAAALQQKLRESYQVESFAHLTYSEAEDVQTKLAAALAAKGQP